MTLSIGELSGKARVKIPTIRYYERIGLLPSPSRSERACRRYEADDVHRLSIIRHARQLGLEIEEIRALFDMLSEGNVEELAILTASLRERAMVLSNFCERLQELQSGIAEGKLSLTGALEVVSGYQEAEVGPALDPVRPSRKGTKSNRYADEEPKD